MMSAEGGKSESDGDAKLEGFSDETFITNLRGEKSAANAVEEDVKAMSKVQELHKQIGSVVGNLNEKIFNVLKKQEEEFLAAYRAHMFNVQKELQALRAKLSDSEVKLNRDEKLRKLEEEKEWYRREALRLDHISTDNAKEMQYMNEKLAGVEDDRKWLEKQLKTCMKQNKFLRAELEIHISESQNERDNLRAASGLPGQMNLQTVPALSLDSEPKLLQTSVSDCVISPNAQLSGDNAPISGNCPQTSPERQVQSSLARYNPTRSEKTEETEIRHKRMIRQLKEQLQQERKKLRDLRASVVTEQTERSGMEELLVKCIDAVKKDIYRRRLRSRAKERKVTPPRETPISQEITRDEYGRIRLKDFSDIDKRKLFHELLSNEQVFTHLYDLIYGSEGNNVTEPEQPKADADGRINASFFPGIRANT